MKSRSVIKSAIINQGLPLILTVVVFCFLTFALWTQVTALNHFTSEDISTTIRPASILIGLTVYLKTAIDFAIFIGRLMDKNTGLKGRVGIEVGSALGNGLGTMLILLIWVFFKEINWLLAAMVLLAGLVLLKLAEDSLEHIDFTSNRYPSWFRYLGQKLENCLVFANKVTGPFLSRIIPSHSMKIVTKTTIWGLLAMSFAVPFILGLDDFAGYVPLFNVVNVFSFGIGVFLGHMILNIFLYISPSRTIKAVKNPIIAFLGSVAFVILAIWGFLEAYKLLFLH